MFVDLQEGYIDLESRSEVTLLIDMMKSYDKFDTVSDKEGIKDIIKQLEALQYYY